MFEIKNKFNVIVGIVIIILAGIVFVYPTGIKTAKVKDIDRYVSNYPSTEANLAYGGDAYTGIQNAGAQTANNVYSVYEAIEGESKNLEIIAKTQAENMEAMINAIKLFVSFILLAVGLITIGNGVAFAEGDTRYVTETASTDRKPMYPNANDAKMFNTTWECTCGVRNPNYVTTCECGVSKRDAESAKGQH